MRGSEEDSLAKLTVTPTGAVLGATIDGLDLSRPLTESEFASELVPKTASPTFCDKSQRHWRTNRSGSGVRSALNGVTTGESTPLIR